MDGIDKKFNDAFESFKDIVEKNRIDLDSHLCAYKELIEDASPGNYFSDNEKGFSVMKQIDERMANLDMLCEWLEINANSVIAHRNFAKQIVIFKESITKSYEERI